MNKTFCYFAMVLCCGLFAMMAVGVLLPMSGDDAVKVRVLEAVVAVGALWSAYRAWYHMRHPDEAHGWENGTKPKLEQMESRGDVLCHFFDPREMRFRTVWSVVVVVALAMFAKPLYAWLMAALLVGLKGWLLWSEIHYWHLYRKLRTLEDMEQALLEEEYDFENASMTVDGEDIIIVDPCYFVSDSAFWENHCEDFAHNRVTEDMGFRKALTFAVSDYQINEVSDGNGVTIGRWMTDSHIVGCFLLDDVLRMNPGFANETDLGVVIRGFCGEVHFRFERKTAPWIYYGEDCDEDTVLMTFEGVGSPSFKSVQDMA